MLDTLRNAWKIEDLRKKLLFTFFILMLTRIGSQIPVPFLDPGALTSMVSSTGGIFSYLDMLTGGRVLAQHPLRTFDLAVHHGFDRHPASHRCDSLS